MGPWVVTAYLLNLVMLGLKQHTASGNYDGPLRAAYLGLVKTGSPPWSKTSTIGGIVEADYSGYARQLVVWFPPYIDTQGADALVGASLLYQPTDALAPNQITGGFLADAATAGNLLCGAMLPSPGVGLPDATTGVSFVPRFSLAFNGDFGGLVVGD